MFGKKQKIEFEEKIARLLIEKNNLISENADLMCEFNKIKNVLEFASYVIESLQDEENDKFYAGIIVDEFSNVDEHDIMLDALNIKRELVTDFSNCSDQLANVIENLNKTAADFDYSYQTFIYDIYKPAMKAKRKCKK